MLKLPPPPTGSCSTDRRERGCETSTSFEGRAEDEADAYAVRPVSEAVVSNGCRERQAEKTGEPRDVA